MNIEDIDYIFQSQIESGTDKLWFMLYDGDYRIIERHDTNDIENLIYLLGNFQYAGNENNMPRFIK